MKTKRVGRKAFQAVVLTAVLWASTVAAAPWKFGIMSDTQWKNTDTTNNPNTVAVGIIHQINDEFITHGVDFVIQVGDLVDSYSTAAFNTRATAAQALYDAGIGFYPLRGNHESNQAAALKFQTLYPQTQGTGSHALPDALHFSSPTLMPGLSYAFEYKGATFILLDQFTRPNGTAQSVLGQDQVDWVSTVLSGKPAEQTAFVFAHKGLITENHTDILFGSNPASAPVLQNQFIKSLYDNGVKYLFGGHDHMHNRAIITSPDGLSQVQDITTASNSYKFYIPQTGSNINDTKYNNPPRETPIAQELFTIGYYIVTVDGPRVTVEFWSAPNGCNGDCDLVNTPALTGNFTLRETFGYSLNGQEFVIASGNDFTVISDDSPIDNGFLGTHMDILGGRNTTSSNLYDQRATVKDVHTGWTSRDEAGTPALSDVLSLWGMSHTLGSTKTDIFALSMSYDPAACGPSALMTKNDAGTWVRAAEGNSTGTPKFVVGPWKQAYGIGTYGLDPSTKTAWAVIDYAGEFAVAPSTDGDLNGDGSVDKDDVAMIMANKNKPASVLPGADLDNDGRITVLDARKETLICNLPGCAKQQ